MVVVNEELYEAYEELTNNSKYRYIICKMSEDKETVTIDKKVPVKALRGMKPKQSWNLLKTDLDKVKDDGYRYVFYDFDYETDCGVFTKLVFISWKPEEATIEQMKGFNAGYGVIKEVCSDIEIEVTSKNTTELHYDKVLGKIDRE